MGSRREVSRACSLRQDKSQRSKVKTIPEDRKHSMSQDVRDSTPQSFPSESGRPRLHHVSAFPCKLQVEKTPPHREGGAVLLSAVFLFGKGLNRLS